MAKNSSLYSFAGKRVAFLNLPSVVPSSHLSQTPKLSFALLCFDFRGICSSLALPKDER